MKNLIITVCLILLSMSLFSNNEEEVMVKEKVLVTYASVAGSTTEVARFIADIFEKEGFDVDFILAENVKSISDYSLVVIGSPVYMGSWRKAVKNFVVTYSDDLNKKHTAYFLTCLALTKENPDFNQIDKYLENERNIVKPISEGRFAGKMDFSKLSFMHKLVAKMVGAKEGDFRDWEKIEVWTKELIKKTIM